MDVKEIRQQFFVYRNGAVADTMRSQGAPYKTIFGLNLPQLAQIAMLAGKSAETAEELWKASNTRECLLLAPMIYPAERLDPDTAWRWAMSAPTAEAADVLCLKLLKHVPFAATLADRLTDCDNPMGRYCGLRLMMHLLPGSATRALASANAELSREDPLTYQLAAQMINRINQDVE